MPRIGARTQEAVPEFVPGCPRQARCPTSTVSNRIKAVGEGLWDSVSSDLASPPGDPGGHLWVAHRLARHASPRVGNALGMIVPSDTIALGQPSLGNFGNQSDRALPHIGRGGRQAARTLHGAREARTHTRVRSRTPRPPTPDTGRGARRERKGW